MSLVRESVDDRMPVRTEVPPKASSDRVLARELGDLHPTFAAITGLSVVREPRVVERTVVEEDAGERLERREPTRIWRPCDHCEALTGDHSWEQQGRTNRLRLREGHRLILDVTVGVADGLTEREAVAVLV